MKRLPRASIIVVLLALASATAVPAASGDDLVVVTNAGPVRGVTTATMQEWRGIPYAAPPVGDLRWRPPATVTPWTDVRAATRFRKPCVQLGETRHDTIGREDCLYLNVFAPMDAIATSSLPVMVHLHPGSNYFGGAYRDPSAFVERGVIVVTLNYRLGILGFNGPKALNEEPGNHSGEYGMLDQIAALEWVQANIAAFGGNPDNVTLFGSSAGTFDTVALMVSPLARGLLDRAAVQGEFVYALTGTFNRINFAYVGGRHAARVSGCNAADDVVACLRSLPARELVKIEGPGDVVPLVGGVVLPESVIELLDDGPEIPLLVGFDREEDRYFALPYPLPELSRPDWIERTTDLVGPEHAEEVRALYPPSEYDSRAWAFVTMQTDVARGCPTRRLANASDGPVWRWLYTNVYDQLDDGDGRAAHVFEEPLLWQIPSAEWFGVDFALTPGEELLSDRMTDYWTNFAKTGNPNGPGLPAWPAYETTTEPTLVLDEEIGVVHGYHSEQCALLDGLDVLYPRARATVRAALAPTGLPRATAA